MHVENKRGKKRREGTTGKKRSEKEGKHPEGSCNGEEEEGVESGNGSGILKEQEGERKACNRGEKQEDPMGTTKKKCTRVSKLQCTVIYMNSYNHSMLILSLSHTHMPFLMKA